jgi:hypothetical protein
MPTTLRPKTTVVIHPAKNGTWPNGEPKSVRDAADAKQATR